MRAFAGIVAFNGLLLLLGLGLLSAVGLLRLRVRELVVAAPAGLLAGAALAGIGGVAILTAGGTLALPAFTAGAVVIAAALWGVGFLRRRRAEPTPAMVAPGDRADRMATLVIVGGVLVFILVQAYSSRNVPAAWDAAHNWALKAFALSTGGLEGDMFTAREPFSAAHLDYPILQPVLGALTYRYAGKGEHGLLLFELWLLAGALVLSGPYLARERARAWLAILPLAAVVAATTSYGILRGDADVTVAIFLAAGVLALGLWLDDGPAGLAVLAALFLGAAVNTKNEGLVYGLAILIAAAVVALVKSRRRLLPLLGVAAAVAACAAPWQLWVRANGPFNRDVTPLSESLDVGWLWDRLDRLDLAARYVLGRLADQKAVMWVMPVFLAVALALLLTGPRRRPAAFYLMAVVAALAGLLWVYWTTPQPDFGGHYARTSLRTITGPLFIAAAALAHLLPRTVMPLAQRREHEPPVGTQDRTQEPRPAGATEERRVEVGRQAGGELRG